MNPWTCHARTVGFQVPIFTSINPLVTILSLSLLSVRILSAKTFPFSSAPIMLELLFIVYLYSKFSKAFEIVLNRYKIFPKILKFSELFRISRQRLRSRRSCFGNTLIVRKTICSFINRSHGRAKEVGR